MQSTDRRHRLANPSTRAGLAILCPSVPSSDSHHPFAYIFGSAQATAFSRSHTHHQHQQYHHVGPIDLARRSGDSASSLSTRWRHTSPRLSYSQASLPLLGEQKQRCARYSFSRDMGSPLAPAFEKCSPELFRSASNLKCSIYRTGSGVSQYHRILFLSLINGHVTTP